MTISSRRTPEKISMRENKVRKLWARRGNDAVCHKFTKGHGSPPPPAKSHVWVFRRVVVVVVVSNPGEFLRLMMKLLVNHGMKEKI